MPARSATVQRRRRRPSQGLTRATRSTADERFSVRITSARCRRSRTLSSSFSSVVSLRRLVAHVDVGDVGLGVADRLGHLRQHALAVLAPAARRRSRTGASAARPSRRPSSARCRARAGACRRCSRRCARSGLRRGRGSRRSRRPGSAGSRCASCTDAPSLPSISTRPCDGAESSIGVAAHRQRERAGRARRARPAARQALGDDGRDLAAEADVDEQLGAAACCRSSACSCCQSARRAAVVGRQRQAFGAQRLREHLLAEAAATPPAPCSSGSGGSWSARGRCARS